MSQEATNKPKDFTVFSSVLVITLINLSLIDMATFKIL